MVLPQWPVNTHSCPLPNPNPPQALPMGWILFPWPHHHLPTSRWETYPDPPPPAPPKPNNPPHNHISPPTLHMIPLRRIPFWHTCSTIMKSRQRSAFCNSHRIGIAVHSIPMPIPTATNISSPHHPHRHYHLHPMGMPMGVMIAIIPPHQIATVVIAHHLPSLGPFSNPPHPPSSSTSSPTSMSMTCYDSYPPPNSSPWQLWRYFTPPNIVPQLLPNNTSHSNNHPSPRSNYNSTTKIIAG